MFFRKNFEKYFQRWRKGLKHRKEEERLSIAKQMKAMDISDELHYKDKRNRKMEFLVSITPTIGTPHL